MKLKTCTCSHKLTTKNVKHVHRTKDFGNTDILWFNCPKCNSTMILKGKDHETRKAA